MVVDTLFFLLMWWWWRECRRRWILKIDANASQNRSRPVCFSWIMHSFLQRPCCRPYTEDVTRQGALLYYRHLSQFFLKSIARGVKPTWECRKILRACCRGRLLMIWWKVHGGTDLAKTLTDAEEVRWRLRWGHGLIVNGEKARDTPRTTIGLTLVTKHAHDILFFSRIDSGCWDGCLTLKRC